MDANRKENVPPWPGGHMNSGQRSVQKKLNINFSVGNEQKTVLSSCPMELGPGHRLELGRPMVSNLDRRQLSTLVQTNLPPSGQPLQDATRMVSNPCFEQQSNLHAWAWRLKPSEKQRAIFFKQNNMNLSREDPERRGGNRNPLNLEGPDRRLLNCSRDLLQPPRSQSAPWSSKLSSQTHRHPFLRDRPSSSLPGFGNSLKISPKATKVQGSESNPFPQSGHNHHPAQPSQRPNCWAPNPTGRAFSLEDLPGQCQQSAHPLIMGPSTELSPELARLLLSRRCREYPEMLHLFKASQEPFRPCGPWPVSNQATSSDKTSEHPSPHTQSCRAVTLEATPSLIPGHPSPLTLSNGTMIPRCHNPLTLSPGAMNLEDSPNFSSMFPKCRPLLPRSMNTESYSNLLLCYRNPHPCSSKAGNPEAPPNLKPGYPGPHPYSNSSGSPEASPNPIILSPNIVSPKAPPNLTPGYPSPPPFPLRPMSPEASPSLTAGYPNLHTFSNKTEAPEASPNPMPGSSLFTLPYHAATTEVYPTLLSEHPNFHTLSSKVMTPKVSPNLTQEFPSPNSLSSRIRAPETPLRLTPENLGPFTLFSSIATPEVSPKLTVRYPNPFTLSGSPENPEASPNLIPRAGTPEASPTLLTLRRPQGVQPFTRAFGMPEKQGRDEGPGCRELGDFSLLSSSSGPAETAPSCSSGTSGMNIFRPVNPASSQSDDSMVALPLAASQSFPPWRAPGLGDPHQAVPASPERSSRPMAGMLTCLPSSRVDRGQEMVEPQLEGHLQKIWEILTSLVPQVTNTPHPGPVKGPVLPTHWGSPKEETSSESEGGPGPGFQNAAYAPHLSGQRGRAGPRNYFSASSSPGGHFPPQQRSRGAPRPNKQRGPWMDPGIARNLGARSWNRSDLHLAAAGASQLDLAQEEKSSVNSLTLEARESRTLLRGCFRAWRCHLQKQWTLAKALRRRQLLQKSILAMRSSLRLREAQRELMKKKQGRALLAKSFQKWKDFSRNRRMRKLQTQSRTETSEEDSLPSQKGQQEKPFVSLGVVYEMEGTPEIKLYPKWKSGSGDRRVPTTQDLRQLAVFHLWHLRKALAAQIHKEARAQAELGKKKLQRAFQAWRASTRDLARISPLVTRHRRAQLDRCFGIWRCHTQRKARCQGSLARWRLETLRRSLRQWVAMVGLQAAHSRAVAQLYLRRQRSWHLEVTAAHQGPSRGGHKPPRRAPGGRAKDSLEEACRKLKLHRVVLLWSRRLAQRRRADSFSQGMKLQLLRRSLRHWRQRVQAAAESPRASCPQELLVGFQDPEESSCGFLGCVVAPLGSSTPRSSSEGARSLTESSGSFGSLAGDDAPWVLALGFRPPPSKASKTWRICVPSGQEHPGPRKQSPTYPFLGAEARGQRKAVQVPTDPGHLESLWQEEGCQEGSRQAPEANQHRQITHQTRVIRSPNQEAARGACQEQTCPKPVWGADQEALRRPPTSGHRFSSSGQQALGELCPGWSQPRASFPKKRVFGKWPPEASMQRTPASCQEPSSLQMPLVVLAEDSHPQGQDWRAEGSRIYRAKRHCLLRCPWAHWNTALPRGAPSRQLAEEEEEESTPVGPGPRIKARLPWRPAIRGHGTLCADPNTLMKQASNYWTRAITLAQAKQKHCSHIGQRKLRKLSVSLGAPKQGFLLASSPYCALHCSSFQLWLQLYRKQGRAKGLTSQEELGKATRQGGGSSRTILIPKSKDHWKAAMLKGTWLERKYLQRWRHEVMLRRFHSQQKTRRLAEVWQCWIDAQGAEQLGRTLVRQWWLEWGWEKWRRQWLQLQVGLRLQDSRISILSQAFGRWYQSWAAQVPRRGSASQLSGVEGQALPAPLGVPPSGEEVQLCPIPSHPTHKS
ncbi:uncharacterized protein C1orf167 homolog isoform X2 [Monodelphis domestica]|uniref:uncharacterized protein C1orf167 homolog isoform X2 n=1 Tax=Monodelphis domestica TaxID=13616 RepID=UPI0024E26535|nr:uncharacterized protein C1orf167 homolog isoform X2 [Monodelphis domestica]